MTPQAPRRWPVVAIGLVGAVALAISVQAGVWWSVGDGTVTIGPFGSHQCFGGDCGGSGLGWIGGSDLWMRSAIATGVAGALASLLLVALAGACAARRVPRVLARMALSTLAAAVACAAYFVSQFPGVAGAGVDRGLVLYAIGVVAGAGAAIAVLRAA
ncbi:MAG TPA: hypothetical protein VMJ10_02935 [Kofleriaceae bacterium]|nr:hypothetical protein [Kofleriaceae bacterium]